MKLYIDTTSSEKVIINLDGHEFIADARKEKAQMLLPFIVEKLKDTNKTLKDLSEIEVATGPGSFTGIRVGVSVAQTLGFSLGIPVNGKDVTKEEIEIQYS